MFEANVQQKSAHDLLWCLKLLEDFSIIQEFILNSSLSGTFAWGHPFMTSTRKGSRSGSGGHMLTGEGESAPRGRLHRKLEPTDVIPSSSHAKKLAFFTIISSLDGINVEISR